MIRIPFDRCVILSTLDFTQITDRLDSAIYDPNFRSLSADNSVPKHQRYVGQIRGFRFLATPIIGHKYLHLPFFLSPTISGKIDSLHHGYEISLAVRLSNLTFTLLLTCLGGLLTTLSSVFDNILGDSKNYQYLATWQIATIFYIAVLAYFYFSAWQATKFFRNLFAQGFAVNTQRNVVAPPAWNSDFGIQEVEDFQWRTSAPTPSSTDWLRKNLPSFPAESSKVR